jgi:hypothetical protein
MARRGRAEPQAMSAAVRDVAPEAVLDAEAFRRELVQPARPAVLRGLVAAWPAVGAGRRSPEAFRAYLARFERPHPVDVFVGAPEIAGRYYYGERLEGFNFERGRAAFPKALDMMIGEGEGGRTLYVGSIPTEPYLPGFAAENRLDALGSVEPRIWLGHASNVSCHYDAMDNLACVVAGRRRFTLYAPELIGDLYVGPVDHTMAGQPVSLAASARPGEPGYPRFEAVRDQALVVDLEPGDALYLPKLWWHQVEATAPFNTLVNYWWDATRAGADPPYATLLLAMIAISERPAPERQAWKAFFDHYVFRSDGHPLAHLPEAQHGMLGPLQPTNYGRIRARVMQMLRAG